MSTLPYLVGKQQALFKLGLEQVHTSNDFSGVVQEDDTEKTIDARKGKEVDPWEKTPAWSNAASLEAGDAATRQYQMGLPDFSGV